MTFKEFANKVNAKFMAMTSQRLFKTNISKEVLWDTYQNAFPTGTNEIFRERRVHECNTCYSFIKNMGALVTVNDDYSLDSIWNVEGLESPYAEVASAMHDLVTSKDVTSIFLTDTALVGKEFNFEEGETPIRWDHFYATIPSEFVVTDVATRRGDIDSTVSVFKRALDEFSVETLKTVIDLCDEIYRGAEFQPTVAKFLEAKEAYEASGKHKAFAWVNYDKYPSKIRNTAIGTLIIDISKGEKSLDDAVKAYETVVAPSNYKRTTAVVTEGMKKEALKTIQELGLEPSLARRHATLADISVNDVIYASGDSQDVMKGKLESLLTSGTKTKPSTKGSTDVTIEDFIKDVVPGATSVEALVENSHVGNLASIVVPENADAPSIFKWNNNASWSYNGEVADSMKTRVKEAGGKVDGWLRFSIQWNEKLNDRNNDLDVHCKCPEGHIYYGDMMGALDVDIRNPGNKTAVENITWPTANATRPGTYRFYINNFSGVNQDGFRAELEINGEVFEYDYSKRVTSDVHVVEVTVNKDKTYTINHLIESSASQKEEWGITTQEYKKVSTMMLSPNFWNDQRIGNKHYFFMLEGCINPSPVRGFYNEFLKEDLTKHRKVFEMLSSMMKCPYEKEQLSGLGFSSTQRNHLHVKVDGRPYKILF